MDNVAKFILVMGNGLYRNKKLRKIIGAGSTYIMLYFAATTPVNILYC